MSKAIILKGKIKAILCIAESKAICPYCEKKFTIDELDDKWFKSKGVEKNGYMKVKCRCKRFVGIAVDMRGDFIAFDLKAKQTTELLLTPKNNNDE